MRRIESDATVVICEREPRAGELWVIGSKTRMRGSANRRARLVEKQQRTGVEHEVHIGAVAAQVDVVAADALNEAAVAHMQMHQLSPGLGGLMIRLSHWKAFCPVISQKSSLPHLSGVLLLMSTSLRTTRIAR